MEHIFSVLKKEKRRSVVGVLNRFRAKGGLGIRQEEVSSQLLFHVRNILYADLKDLRQSCVKP